MGFLLQAIGGMGRQFGLWPTGTVSIKDSVFDNNEKNMGVVGNYWGNGLVVEAGAVTLENIQANNNAHRGIYSLTNNSFNGYHMHTDGNGLIPDDSGDYWSGVVAHTCLDFDGNAPYCDNTGAGTITIKTSSSIGNGYLGYNIYAKGAITLYDVLVPEIISTLTCWIIVIHPPLQRFR